MKKFFTIQEIANLYRVSVDAIRYYEKRELIFPKREDNGYRTYSLDDVSRLNIIRDLLELNFSTDAIKEYFDNMNTSHSTQMYRLELNTINSQINTLIQKRDALSSRIERINCYKVVPPNIISIKNLPKRECYELESRMTSDAQTELVIKQLHRSHQGHLSALGDLEIGSKPLVTRNNTLSETTMQSVFFIEDSLDDGDFTLSAGKYLSIFFQGSYDQSNDIYTQLTDYADTHGYTYDESPFEIYHVDNRFTNHEDEYITEVQLHVR